MLTLERRKGQEIILNFGRTEVCIKVVRITRTRVKIGVTAPKTVKVIRQEVRAKDAARLRSDANAAFEKLSKDSDDPPIHLHL